MIQSSRYLPSRLKEIIDPVIQRNGYFAHAENLLLSMITDDSKDVRSLGFRRILKARESRAPSGNKVRQLKVPMINFNATEYYGMIDWTANRFEPSITKSIPEISLALP